MGCPAYNKIDAADVKSRAADLQLKPFFDKNKVISITDQKRGEESWRNIAEEMIVIHGTGVETVQIGLQGQI